MSDGHSDEPWKNGRNNRDAVCGVESRGLKKPCIKWGIIQIPNGKRHVYGCPSHCKRRGSHGHCRSRMSRKFLPRDALLCKAQSCDRSHVVCPSVTLVDHDNIGRKSWKLIVQAISPTSSLFVAQRSCTYFQGNMEKFWRENVRSTAMSITSTESHVILGGGVTCVAVCLL